MPRRPSLGDSTVAVLVGLAAIASGAHAAGERALASQLGRVTAKVQNGVHSGSLVSRHAPGDPLGLIGAFQLDYALWTLLDQPVEDFQFRWELGPELRFPGGEKTTLERLRRDEPGLYVRLQALAPVAVTLRARVRFFDAAPTSFAEADLDLAPDLTAPSGRPQGFSAPGSPAWGAWFSNVKLGANLAAASQDGTVDLGALCALPTSTKTGNEACVRKVWARARRVELTGASVIGVEWPETETRQLLGEIWARHHRAEQKARDRAASDATFWATPAGAALPVTAARDLPTVTVATTARAVDKGAREARKSRFQTNDHASFSISVASSEAECRNTGTVDVVVHAGLAAAAPTVLFDGARLSGQVEAIADAARHTFTFPFSAGTHTLDVELQGPHPIKRHQRVSCFTSETMVPCLGANDCPKIATCPCGIVK